VKISVGLREVPMARAEALVNEARRRALAYLEARHGMRFGSRTASSAAVSVAPQSATKPSER
jgi:hypothetical protein